MLVCVSPECALLQETPARTYSSVRRMLLQQMSQGTSERQTGSYHAPEPPSRTVSSLTALTVTCGKIMLAQCVLELFLKWVHPCTAHLLHDVAFMNVQILDTLSPNS